VADDALEVARRTAAAMQRADTAGNGAGARLLDVGPGRATVGLSNSHGTSAVASGADIAFLRPVPLGAELVADAVERAKTGRSGLYDVTVRVGDEAVAEFRGRTRQVPGLTPPP
jgi:acyl-CoA thioesterase